MNDSVDPQLELVFSFYEGIFQKGPGSNETTLKALALLDSLPQVPRIVDLGAGSGPASLVLARSLECQVTAVDIHQPFLDELQALAARDGLDERIKTVQADMANPPFPDHSFDLIWSEGAIYNVGFAEGLRRWRRLLAPGGSIAVTEVTWLGKDPPHKAREFWQSEYPAMTTIDENLSMVRSAGFEPVDHLVLPSSDWENYYGPLRHHLSAFRATHPENKDAQELANNLQNEIDVWQEYGDSYGYVFYLGKAA